MRRPRAGGVLALAAAAIGAAGIAGCGSGGSTRSAHDLPAVRVASSVEASEQAAHAQVMASLDAKTGAGGAAGIPAALRHHNAGDNRIVTATPAHPQLAIAGDSVVVDVPGGSALATLNGPLYNNKYVGTNDPTVPAKFVLQLSHVHGTVPLAAEDFTVLDQQGNNILPSVSVRGGGGLPRQITTGQQMTVDFSTIIAAGDGSIVYNPTGIVKPGHRPLAGWDFIVEDD